MENDWNEACFEEISMNDACTTPDLIGTVDSVNRIVITIVMVSR